MSNDVTKQKARLSILERLKQKGMPAGELVSAPTTIVPEEQPEEEAGEQSMSLSPEVAARYGIPLPTNKKKPRSI